MQLTDDTLQKFDDYLASLSREEIADSLDKAKDSLLQKAITDYLLEMDNTPFRFNRKKRHLKPKRQLLRKPKVRFYIYRYVMMGFEWNQRFENRIIIIRKQNELR